MRQGELELAVDELLDSWPPDTNGCDVTVQLRVVPLDGTAPRRYHSRVNNLDTAESGAVAACELRVELFHGADKGHITVLLVHVMRARA